MPATGSRPIPVLDVRAPRPNGIATASLTLALVGIVVGIVPLFIGLALGFVPVVLALVFGVVGLARALAGQRIRARTRRGADRGVHRPAVVPRLRRAVVTLRIHRVSG